MAESDKDNVEVLKKACKYCKKNVLKGFNCVNCDAVYHNSCALRIKMCCDSSNLKERIQMDSDICATEELYLKDINQLLTQTIKDKDTIISDEVKLIALLNDKILHLEDIISKSNKTCITTIDKEESTGSPTKKVEVRKNSTYDKMIQKSSNPISDKKADTSRQEIVNRQTSIMSHLINIEDDRMDSKMVSKLL
ncbi:unnamed protein product [Phaedon cochleariae]|uniref:Phorbol-ester/DAG-type domain-containing protein n=1 Tax=Phaedon cochleariae TaxID=80249 RepID=A0A9N9SHE2_PHACE|nr:unnamed protein product [Phaedon cochleariae]